MRHPSKVGHFCARKMLRTGGKKGRIMGPNGGFVGYGRRRLNINCLGHGGPPMASNFRTPGRSGLEGSAWRRKSGAQELDQATVLKNIQKAAAAFKARLARKVEKYIRSAEIRKVGVARGR